MSFINKFGESTTPKIKFTNTKLRSMFLKMFNIGVNNHVFDMHQKRITNLVAPIDPKDAVTKAYLKRSNDLLTNKIDEVVKDFETKIQYTIKAIVNIITNEIKHANKNFEKKILDLQNEINKLSVLKNDVEDIAIATQNHIKKEENVIEQSVKKQILTINKEHMKKFGERFNKIEEYIFKWVGVNERVANLEDYLFKNIGKRPPVNIPKYS